MMSFIFAALFLVGVRSQPTADITAARVVRAAEAEQYSLHEHKGNSDNSVVRQADAAAIPEVACGGQGCERQPVVRGVAAGDIFTVMREELRASHVNGTAGVDREFHAAGVVREESVQSTRVNRVMPATEADDSSGDATRRLAAVAGNESQRFNRKVPAAASLHEKNAQSTRVNREVPPTGIIREESAQSARVNREVSASEVENSFTSNLARRLAAVWGDESTRVNQEVPATAIVRDKSVQPTRVNRQVLAADVEDSFASNVARRLTAVVGDASLRVNREVPATGILREESVQLARVNREAPA